jgi:hypothetical protein
MRRPGGASHERGSGARGTARHPSGMEDLGLLGWKQPGEGPLQRAPR